MKRMILLAITFLAGTWAVSGQNTTEWATYLEGYEITEIAVAGDYLWLTDGKEVMKFDKNTAVTEFYDLNEIEKSPDYVITSIKCDHSGLPWIAVTSVGLLKMDAYESWSLHSPVSEAHSDLATHIFISDNDVVWTWRTFPFYDYTPGALWNMPRTLTRYQGNRVDTFKLEGHISSVAEDDDGNLWITEWEWDTTSTDDLRFSPFAAIVKYDGNNWTTYYWPEKYIGTPMNLHDISFDESGNIWMGGAFGLLGGRSRLILFNQSDWQVFELPEDARWMTSLALQDNGAIWMGSSSIGLMRYRNSQWTVYDTEHSEPHSGDINSIFIDEHGTKWIGTGNGLAAYNENGFNFPEEPANSIGTEIIAPEEPSDTLDNDINLPAGPADTADNEVILPEEPADSSVNVIIVPDEQADSTENVSTPSTDLISEVMEEVEIFPNPTQGFLILKINGDKRYSTVDILNVHGQKLITFSINKKQSQLDVSHLTPGTYLVRIHSKQKTISKKFVKH